MADLLQTAATWLGGMFTTHASQPVTFEADGHSIALMATLGRTEHEVTDEYGLTTTSETADFIVPAEDLLIDSQPITPEAGNQFRITRGSEVHVYEVMHPVAGKEPWKWCDPHHVTRRIHTKHVTTEPAQ